MRLALSTILHFTTAFGWAGSGSFTTPSHDAWSSIGGRRGVRHFSYYVITSRKFDVLPEILGIYFTSLGIFLSLRLAGEFNTLPSFVTLKVQARCNATASEVGIESRWTQTDPNTLRLKHCLLRANQDDSTMRSQLSTLSALSALGVLLGRLLKLLGKGRLRAGSLFCGLDATRRDPEEGVRFKVVDLVEERVESVFAHMYRQLRSTGLVVYPQRRDTRNKMAMRGRGRETMGGDKLTNSPSPPVRRCGGI